MPRRDRTDQAIQPLNAPRPIRVELHANGVPRTITIDGQRHTVAHARDSWRVDDLWWRPEEHVSRRYFALELEDGALEIVYQDERTGDWYRQRY